MLRGCFLGGEHPLSSARKHVLVVEVLPILVDSPFADVGFDPPPPLVHSLRCFMWICRGLPCLPLPACTAAIGGAARFRDHPEASQRRHGDVPLLLRADGRNHLQDPVRTREAYRILHTYLPCRGTFLL